MGVPNLNADYIYDSTQQQFINMKHRRIAEILTDYNPHLSLIYMPHLDTGLEDAQPYAVVHSTPNVEKHIVMFLAADEINETLIARIWAADTSKNDPIAYLEKLEAAQQAVKLREEMDRREEAKDKALFMLKTGLHTINLGNGVKVDT